MTNTYYQQIVVKIEIEEDTDIQEVGSECDYNFNTYGDNGWFLDNK